MSVPAAGDAAVVQPPVPVVVLATTAAQIASAMGIAIFPVMAPHLARMLDVDASYVGYQISLLFGAAMLASGYVGTVVLRWGACSRECVAGADAKRRDWHHPQLPRQRGNHSHCGKPQCNLHGPAGAPAQHHGPDITGSQHRRTEQQTDLVTDVGSINIQHTRQVWRHHRKNGNAHG
jgi:hypothetical protein